MKAKVALANTRGIYTERELQRSVEGLLKYLTECCLIHAGEKNL
jgi:hypothetical protein